jgi:hypothetical protein
MLFAYEHGVNHVCTRFFLLPTWHPVRDLTETRSIASLQPCHRDKSRRYSQVTPVNVRRNFAGVIQIA